MVFVPLPRVHEVFGEPVPVLNVVPASAPDPVTCHVLGATRLAAPTLTELPLPARATDRVYDPSRRHRVSKSGFPACWGKKGKVCELFQATNRLCKYIYLKHQLKGGLFLRMQLS